jgi:pimeloyl-ACP methyl ester carboxylesterase
MSNDVKSNQLFRRSNGEQITFAEYGNPQGQPVLFCHSSPGSRFQITSAMERVAAIKNVRLIIPDRPGYGDSNIFPGKPLLDWPASIDELLASLDIGPLSVIGHSMGGMYALACVYARPKRFFRAALVGSISPAILHQEVLEKMPESSVALFNMARDEPTRLQQILAPLVETPEHLLTMFAAPMPESDREIFFNPDVNAMFMRDCMESLKPNAEGLTNDFALSTRYWGFNLEDINTPIAIWHGINDTNIPLPAAHYLVSHLNVDGLHLLPDEGHLCLFTHWEEILDSVVE